MAEFLTTTGNAHYLEQIILKATKELIIVSPYLKMNHIVFERLNDAQKRGVLITIIYGKSELNEIEERKLYSIENIEIYFNQHLHAKCYCNENMLIISSMNLYEFSEKNNREMGVFFTKDENLDIYKNATEEIHSIISASTQKKKRASNDQTEINAHVDDVEIPKDILSSIEYRDTHFYFPVLKQQISKKFVCNEFNITKRLITIEGFNGSAVDLYLSRTIELKFRMADYYELKKELSNQLQQGLPHLRIYSRSRGIEIYSERDFSFESNEQGLVKAVDFFMNALTHLKVVLDKLKVT